MLYELYYLKNLYKLYHRKEDEIKMLIHINEVYFGKKPEIIAIENQLDKFRHNYMGNI